MRVTSDSMVYGYCTEANELTSSSHERHDGAEDVDREICSEGLGEDRGLESEIVARMELQRCARDHCPRGTNFIELAGEDDYSSSAGRAPVRRRRQSFPGTIRNPENDRQLMSHQRSARRGCTYMMSHEL